MVGVVGEEEEEESKGGWPGRWRMRWRRGRVRLVGGIVMMRGMMMIGEVGGWVWFEVGCGELGLVAFWGKEGRVGDSGDFCGRAGEGGKEGGRKMVVEASSADGEPSVVETERRMLSLVE